MTTKEKDICSTVLYIALILLVFVLMPIAIVYEVKDYYQEKEIIKVTNELSENIKKYRSSVDTLINEIRKETIDVYTDELLHKTQQLQRKQWERDVEDHINRKIYLWLGKEETDMDE